MNTENQKFNEDNEMVQLTKIILKQTVRHRGGESLVPPEGTLLQKKLFLRRLLFLLHPL